MFAASTEATSAVLTSGFFLENAWVIPVIPAVAFALIIFFGKKMPMKGSEIGILSMVASLVFSGGAIMQWIDRVNGAGEYQYVAPVVKTWTWWQSGGIEFGLGQHVDGLTLAVLGVVAFISTLVQIYSVEYLRGDRRYTHFFASLTLFSAGMMNMVVAENMIQLILGWEIMGLCSFMLIGHWWEEGANSRAALKAFFTTRTGDVGLLAGTSILFFAANDWTQKTLGVSGFSIRGLSAWALSGDPSHAAILWGAAALFVAAIGKSGQFPLHTWLPDAMAGPTPVSSLLHSSTMVVAGVFLVARLYPVFFEGLGILGGSSNFIVIIGGTTIVIAAALAFVQTDIKKVLAYSTVSQLGYMMMGLGVGAWVPAVFHIFTHAFFKCCLFLCAGSVAHTGSHHSFDMKTDMGGLRKKMPVTFVTWVISTAALCGLPFLSGFFSKDEIIDSAHANHYSTFWIIGLVGAFMTTAYMTRATYLTFFGKPRGGAAHFVGGHHDDHDDHAHGDAHGDHAHDDAHGHDDHHAPVAHGKPLPFAPSDSPWQITVPLIILGALAVVSGYLNAAPFHWHPFEHWLESSIGLKFGEGPGTLPEPPTFKWINAAPSIVLVLLGFAVSLFLSRKVFSEGSNAFKGLTERNALLRGGHRFLVNKYYLDAIYEGGIVKAIAHPISKAAYWVNQNVIDGIVNRVGITGRRTGEWVYKNVDQRLVDGVVNGSGTTARGAGGALQPVQSGKVSLYGALLFGAAAVGALVLVLVNS